MGKYLTCLLFLQLTLSVFFFYFQNKDKLVGGRISLPKAFWLFHAIFSWYFVPLVFLIYLIELNFIWWLLLIHTLVWWIRAPIELIMMYKTHNWSPLYGITHDVLHSIIILAGFFYIILVIRSDNKIDNTVTIYLGVTFLMLVFESYFAYKFYKIRGRKKKTVYYANNEPEWRNVNRVTVIAVFIGILHSVFQISYSLR